MDADKRTIYFARRIPVRVDPNVILSIHPSMTLAEVKNLYAKKKLDKGKYIHNGHWVLRPLNTETSFETSNVPKAITPYDIWSMVQQKMDSSDAMLAVVTQKAYGTIAEVGYASGSGKVGIYVLPEKGMSVEEIQDLWLIFQTALNTKHLWQEQDIENIPEFQGYNIYSIQDYSNFIKKIIPAFLMNSDSANLD